MTTPAPSTAPASGRSLRLTFAFDERGLRLAGAQRRRKAAPPGHDTRLPAPDHAVVVELRAADGRALHRRLLHDPIPQSVEIVNDQGRFERVPTALPRGPSSPWYRTSTRHDLVVDAGPRVRLAQPALAGVRLAPGGRRELGRFAVPRGL
ncbi:MAG: hypothetical protein R2731_17240 [Nocardioides sp.]